MKLFKTLFDFYIQSSIHVALAICALTGITFTAYNLPFDDWLFIFLFTASITGYNFAKYAGSVGFHHRGLTQQMKSIQIFSGICFLVLGISVFYQSLNCLLITAALGVFTFFYSIPFSVKAKGLRNFKGVKIGVIALVWAGATLWLPLADDVRLWTWDVFFRSLFYMVFVLALILPFEIRDLKYDLPELGTFPQQYGVKNTKKFGYFLLILFVALSFFIPSLGRFQEWIALFIAALTGFLVWNASKEKDFYYTAFWVESVPILWFCLCYLFL